MKKKRASPGLARQRENGKRIVPPIPMEQADYAKVKEAAGVERVPVAQFIRNAAINDAEKKLGKAGK